MHNQHTQDHDLEARFHREAERYMLSPQEKEQMRSVLHSYAQLKPIRSVREHRPVRQVSAWNLIFSARSAVAILVLVVIGSSAGVTSAAEASLPGDFLYAVKRRVNEPVIEALAVSAEAKAQTATKLARRRLDEAAELSRQGRLAEATRDELTRDFEKHVEVAVAVIEHAPVAASAAQGSTTPSVSALEQELAVAEQQLERLSASTTDLAPVIASVKKKKERTASRRRPEELAVAIASSSLPSIATTTATTTEAVVAAATRPEKKKERTAKPRVEEVRRAEKNTKGKSSRAVQSATTTRASTTIATSTASTTEGFIEATIHASERAGSYIGESVRSYLKRWTKERPEDRRNERQRSNDKIQGETPDTSSRQKDGQDTSDGTSRDD